jgi:hypothetical protein
MFFSASSEICQSANFVASNDILVSSLSLC